MTILKSVVHFGIFHALLLLVLSAFITKSAFLFADPRGTFIFVCKGLIDSQLKLFEFLCSLHRQSESGNYHAQVFHSFSTALILSFAIASLFPIPLFFLDSFLFYSTHIHQIHSQTSLPLNSFSFCFPQLLVISEQLHIYQGNSSL